jgi:hypothetical protein
MASAVRIAGDAAIQRERGEPSSRGEKSLRGGSKRVIKIAALGSEVAREIADEVGVVEAARLGLGKALEVIQVVLQTPDWHYSLIQEYERLGASKMFIRFVGQPHEFDDSDGTARASGRGMAFFRGGAA